MFFHVFPTRWNMCVFFFRFSWEGNLLTFKLSVSCACPGGCKGPFYCSTNLCNGCKPLCYFWIPPLVSYIEWHARMSCRMVMWCFFPARRIPEMVLGPCQDGGSTMCLVQGRCCNCDPMLCRSCSMTSCLRHQITRTTLAVLQSQSWQVRYVSFDFYLWLATL